MKLTQITGPTLRRAETKVRKKFKLEALEKENSKTIGQKKKKMKWQRNTTQMKEKTRNTEVQINKEEISKLPKKNSEK